MINYRIFRIDDDSTKPSGTFSLFCVGIGGSCTAYLTSPGCYCCSGRGCTSVREVWRNKCRTQRSTKWRLQSHNIYLSWNVQGASQHHTAWTSDSKQEHYCPISVVLRTVAVVLWLYHGHHKLCRQPSGYSGRITSQHCRLRWRQWNAART